jgi:hypothetical protein
MAISRNSTRCLPDLSHVPRVTIAGTRVDSDLAATYAQRNRLLPARHWTADFVLESAREVWIVDTEYGKADSVATESVLG